MQHRNHSIWANLGLPVFFFIGVLLVAVGCDSHESIHVFVPASAQDAVGELAQGYQEETGVQVLVNAESTSLIIRQVKSGAPADVVITADTLWMNELEKNMSFRERSLAATNELVVVSRKALGSWTAVATVDRLALAGPQVPAGRYARQSLESAELVPRGQVVEASNVRDVLRWVKNGEADAGIVYASDVVSAPELSVVVIPSSAHESIVYPVALLSDEPNARAFYQRIVGEKGRSAFFRHGFGATAASAAVGVAPEISLRDAIFRGIWVAIFALFFSFPFALGFGWWLASSSFRGKSLVTTFLLTPLVLPPVVTGYLLLALLGRQTMIGGVLSRLGIELSFSSAGAVVAAGVVGFPLFVLACRNAFEAIDPDFYDVGQTLGLSRIQLFQKIALPLAAPGIFGGAVLAFARGLGEFGATVVFVGNAEGATRTIPLAVYALLESPQGEGDAILLAWVSVGISLACVGLWERTNAWQKSRMEWKRG
jgi:molybdate transport system permease protein